MINGKELMIGDYVAIAEYDSLDVGVVKEIHADGEEMCISIDGQVCDVLADKDISALFLSKAFFLENGYTELYRDNHVTRLYNRNYIGLRVNIYPPENYVRFRVDGIEINYVHEFQHYLRLVNLSDYANSLKI